jgi:hypothetical protein
MCSAGFRGLATLSLVAWLVSAWLGQMLWFHVETEHVGQCHHESHGVTTLHADAKRDHEHQISSSTGLPAIAGPRISFPPTAAIQILPWLISEPRRIDPSAPDPRPRGSPFTLEHLTILLI